MYTHKTIIKIALELAAFFVFIIAAITTQSSSVTKIPSTSTSPSLSLSETQSVTPTVITIPSEASNQMMRVKVVNVVDGDTIKIETGQTIRYIGIDAPETVHPSRPIMCFGKEASEKNTQLVEGKIVELEKDVSETDKYGRLLRYIWLDGILINELLVREGFAQSSTYPPDVKYQDRFVEAQRLAREEEKGLWSSICE